MKKGIIIFLMTIISQCALATDPIIPLTVDFRARTCPGLEVYQANQRVFNVTINDGQSVYDYTGRTPYMWWSPMQTSNLVGVVLAAITNQSPTNGTFTATWSPTDLNTNGVFWYGVGLASNGVLTTARIGSLRIIYDPYATGASPIDWATDVNCSLYNFINPPWVSVDSVLPYIAATSAADRVYSAGLTNGFVDASITNGLAKTNDIPADNLAWQSNAVDSVARATFGNYMTTNGNGAGITNVNAALLAGYNIDQIMAVGATYYFTTNETTYLSVTGRTASITAPTVSQSATYIGPVTNGQYLASYLIPMNEMPALLSKGIYSFKFHGWHTTFANKNPTLRADLYIVNATNGIVIQEFESAPVIVPAVSSDFYLLIDVTNDVPRDGYAFLLKTKIIDNDGYTGNFESDFGKPYYSSFTIPKVDGLYLPYSAVGSAAYSNSSAFLASSATNSLVATNDTRYLASLTNIVTASTNLPAGALAYVGGVLYGGTNDNDGAYINTNRTITVNGVTSNLNNNPIFTIQASDPNAITNNQNNVTLGSNTLFTGNVAITGRTDQVQLSVQANGTQNSNVVEVLSSNGVVQASISKAGAISGGAITSTGNGIFSGAISSVGQASSGSSYLKNIYNFVSNIPINLGMEAASPDTSTTGIHGSIALKSFYNQSSGTATNTDLLISRTETLLSPTTGVQRLISAQVGGVELFGVDNRGGVRIVGATNQPQLAVKANVTQTTPTLVVSNATSQVFSIGKDGDTVIAASLTAGVTTNTGEQVNGSITATGNVIAASQFINAGMTNLNYVYVPVYTNVVSGTTNYTINPANGSEQAIVATQAVFITSSALAANNAGLIGLCIDSGTNSVTWDTNVFNSSEWPVIGTNGTDVVLRKMLGSTMWTVNGPALNSTVGGTLTASNVVLSTYRWKDSPMVFSWLNAGAVAPARTSMGGGVNVLGYADDDELDFMCQLNHDIAPSNSTGYVEPHAHVIALTGPDPANNRTTIRIIYYAAGIGGTLYGPTTNSVGVALSTNTHHLIEFSHQMFTNHYPSISGKYWGTLKRLASVSSNYTGVISLDGDFHYPVDRIGSSGDATP